MAQLLWTSHKVTLPSAKFGNQLILHLRTKINRAMSNKFWAYKTTPVRQSLVITFADMNRPTILKIRDFLIVSAGKEVWYTDHAGRIWKGYVTTSAHVFEHVAIRNNTFNLEMELING